METTAVAQVIMAVMETTVVITTLSMVDTMGTTHSLKPEEVTDAQTMMVALMVHSHLGQAIKGVVVMVDMMVIMVIMVMMVTVVTVVMVVMVTHMAAGQL
ncbi:MAG: hypothetical protein K2Y18_06045 [Alphaproteobacteria bacterium]|nr:hypothetical protein [Alphaproteobacteria bacterium]